MCNYTVEVFSQLTGLEISSADKWILRDDNLKRTQGQACEK